MDGPLGLALVTAMVFAATYASVAVVFKSSARAKQNQQLQRRLLGSDATDRLKQEREDDEHVEARFLPRGLVALVERLLDRAEQGSDGTGVGRKVDRLLERVAWSVTPAEFIAGSALIGVAGGAVGGLLVPSVLFMVLFGGLCAAVPSLAASIKGKRRLAKLQTQLPDTLTVLASSLRAGHSFLQALESVAKEVPEPSAAEFKRVVTEIRLGRDSQDALEDMADRIGSDDFRWSVLAISIQREVGGNLAEVLDTVAHTIREREGVRRQVEVLSAEGKLSMGVLSGLPIAMAAYMGLVNPEYVGLLFSSQLGVVMVAVGASLWVLGFVWMKKVVKIDV